MESASLLLFWVCVTYKARWSGRALRVRSHGVSTTHHRTESALLQRLQPFTGHPWIPARPDRPLLVCLRPVRVADGVQRAWRSFTSATRRHLAIPQMRLLSLFRSEANSSARCKANPATRHAREAISCFGFSATPRPQRLGRVDACVAQTGFAPWQATMCLVRQQGTVRSPTSREVMLGAAASAKPARSNSPIYLL